MNAVAMCLLQNADASGVLSYTIRSGFMTATRACARVDSRRVDTIAALRAGGVRVRATRVDYTHRRRASR